MTDWKTHRFLNCLTDLFAKVNRAFGLVRSTTTTTNIYLFSLYPWYFSSLQKLKKFNVFSLVPSTGPVILEAYSISTTAVFVRWNETSIPKEKWNGIPRGFRVHGHAQPCTGFLVTPRNVALDVSTFIVTGLKAWALYVLKISGVTRPGHGIASEVRIRTKDSGNVLAQIDALKCQCYVWVVLCFHLLKGKRKHKSKRKKKDKFLSLFLYLFLCRHQGHFHG